MKAAVLHQLDTIPRYEDVPEPKPTAQQEEVLKMEAAPLKNLDKLFTSSSFYAAHNDFPTVVGSDGVGITEDGKRVYAMGVTGMFAEKALIQKDNFVVLPDQLSAELGAALPNAVMGAVLPLMLRGKIRRGDVVVINGGTGFTGQLAVQAALRYGASQVIVTGRNKPRLAYLGQLGASELIFLERNKVGQLTEKIREILAQTPIDLVLDYLWGPPAEALIRGLVQGETYSTRFVNVGNMAGLNIELSAGAIRNSAIEILGAGLGSYTTAEFKLLMDKFIPETFDLVAQGKIKMDVQVAPLKDIESAWTQKVESGKRLVIRP